LLCTGPRLELCPSLEGCETDAAALPCSSLRLPARRFHRLHAVGDGVVPEAIEALQRAVHLLEFVRVDAADLFDRADMALIEARHDFRHFGTLFRQADADRTAVDARALMVDEAEIDQLLEVIGHVGAEIV